MRRKFLLLLTGVLLLAAGSYPAFSAMTVTNNAQLVEHPEHFWSTTFKFQDEFQSVGSSYTYRFGRTKYYQIQGREITFYVPQIMAPTLARLKPGDKINIEAMIQNEDQGLVIVALRVSLDNQVITAAAGNNGTIEPFGEVEIPRGSGQTFDIKAAYGCHIDQVLVDNLPVGSFGRGSNTFRYVFNNVTNRHMISCTFAHDVYELKVESSQVAVSPPPGVVTFDFAARVTAQVNQSPVEDKAAGIRYVCTGWTGGGGVPESGKGTRVEFVITNDASVTWNWDREYWLSVGKEQTGLIEGREGWYAVGTPVDLKATPGKRCRFVQWKGDVPESDIRKDAIKLTMDRARSVIAVFEQDAYVVNAEAGKNGSIEPAGEVEILRGKDAEFVVNAEPGYHIDRVTVDGTGVNGVFGQGSNRFVYTFSGVLDNHAISAMFAKDVYTLDVTSRMRQVKPEPGSHTFEYGAIIDAKVERATVEERSFGARYTCLGWTGQGDVPAGGTGTAVRFTLTQDSGLTWNWKTDYYLSLESREGGDVKGEEGWHTQGAEVVLTAEPGKKYRFVSWDGGVPPEDELKNPVAVTMDVPRAISAVFERDVQTVTADAGPNGAIEPTGTVEVARGDSVEFKITAADHHHIHEVLMDGQPYGVFGQGSNTVTIRFDDISANHTLSAAFAKDRYALAVVSEAEAVNPKPGEHEFDQGTLIEARAEKAEVEDAAKGVRYVLKGFKGTGDAPVSGTGAVVRFVLTRHSTITWNWATQYRLELSAGDGGKVDGNAGWYSAGTTVKVRAVPDSEYRFSRWTGDIPRGLEDKESLDLLMDRPRNLSAGFEWDSRVIRTTAGENGSIEPSGEIPVAKGKDVVFSIKAADGCHINRVLVDGKPTGSFAQGSNLFAYTFSKVEEGHTLAADFAKNKYTLTVESGFKDAKLPPDRYTYDYGSVVEAKVGKLPEENKKTGIRFVCRGWTGTGDVPESGTDMMVRFTITRDSGLTWNWVTEYFLKLNTGAGGAIQTKPGWYAEGETVTVVTQPDAEYRFLEWMGDVPGGQEEVHPLVLVMDRPRTISATYAHDLGTLAIDVDPDTASWSLSLHPLSYSGPTAGSGDLDSTPAPSGTYAVVYEEMARYKTPPSQTLAVAPGELASFSGIFTIPPELALSSQCIVQDVVVGQGVSNQEFEVWNSGGGGLKYIISRNVPWMFINPKMGVSTGEHDVVKIEYDTSGLMPGVYTGLVTVAVRNEESLPKEIPVTLAIRYEQEVARKMDDLSARNGGLVAYYPLNGNTEDASGYNNHGTVHGELGYVEHAPFGQAGEFKQRGRTFIEIPHQDQLVLSNSFTIQFWYKNGAYSGRIIQKLWPTKHSGGKEWEITIRDNTQAVFKYAWPGVTDNYEFVCPLNYEWARESWNHFVYAYSAGENVMYGYLNGVAVTNQVLREKPVPLDTTLPLLLMHDRFLANTDARFDAEGSLDEVSIWNRMLTSSEVWDLYVSGVKKVE